MKKLIWLIVFILLVLTLQPTIAAAAGGTGPGDALLPVGLPQTIGAHSAVWYFFDYSGDKSLITATVDDQGASGIRLAIYTPDEIAAWQNGDALSAIGLGSPIVGHDMGWVGRFNFPGRFYAVVYNDSDSAISASVKVTGDAVTTTPNNAPLVTLPSNPFAVVTPLGKGISGRLAFVDGAGGNLYVVNGDGTSLHRVSFGIDPQWNHAGTLLALARQGPQPGIYTISADGSNENAIFGGNEVRAPDWSPDDSQVIFSRQGLTKGGGQLCFRGRCFSLPEDVQWKLGLVSSSGGSFTDVRSTAHSFTPTWNRDGVTIAYNDLEIGIMQTPVNGESDAFPIIGDLRVTSPGYSPLKLMSPQYSPDGKSIVYMVLQQPAWQIAIASADGSNQRLLTRLDPLDFVHPNNVAPVWSPDGKQILFLSDRNGKWEFFLMNVDGSGQKQVLKALSDQITLKYEFQSDRMMSWTR